MCGSEEIFQSDVQLFFFPAKIGSVWVRSSWRMSNWAAGPGDSWPRAVVGTGCRQATAWKGGATVRRGDKRFLSGKGQKKGIQCKLMCLILG